MKYIRLIHLPIVLRAGDFGRTSTGFGIIFSPVTPLLAFRANKMEMNRLRLIYRHLGNNFVTYPLSMLDQLFGGLKLLLLWPLSLRRHPHRIRRTHV